MAYQNNIPQPSDRLSISQAELLNNFAAIQTLIDINHYSFASPNEGKHLYLQLPEHAAPTTAANEAGLYAAVGPVSTVTELVFRRESNGASIFFTEGSLVTNGWTRLPSGLLMQWGTASISDSGTTSVSFPINFTNPNGCLNVQASAKSTSTNEKTIVNMTSITYQGFQCRTYGSGGSQVASAIYLFAVGI